MIGLRTEPTAQLGIDAFNYTYSGPVTDTSQLISWGNLGASAATVDVNFEGVVRLNSNDTVNISSTIDSLLLTVFRCAFSNSECRYRAWWCFCNC